MASHRTGRAGDGAGRRAVSTSAQVADRRRGEKSRAVNVRKNLPLPSPTLEVPKFVDGSSQQQTAVFVVDVLALNIVPV